MRVVIVLEGKEYSYPVSKSPLVMGRDTNGDIPVNTGSVSRRHAEVFVRDQFLVVRDLGSKNGIKINDHKVKEGVLRHNQFFILGKVQVFFQVHEEPLPTADETGVIEEDLEEKTPVDDQFVASPAGGSGNPEESAIEEIDPDEPIGAASGGGNKKVLLLSLGLLTTVVVLGASILGGGNNGNTQTPPPPQSGPPPAPSETKEEIWDHCYAESLFHLRRFLAEDKLSSLRIAEERMRTVTDQGLRQRRLDEALRELVQEFKLRQSSLRDLDYALLVGYAAEIQDNQRFATNDMKEHAKWFINWLNDQSDLSFIYEEFEQLVFSNNIEDLKKAYAQRNDLQKDKIFWPRVADAVEKLPQRLEDYFVAEGNNAMAKDNFNQVLQIIASAVEVMGNLDSFKELKAKADNLIDADANVKGAWARLDDGDLVGAKRLTEKVPDHPKYIKEKQNLLTAIANQVLTQKVRTLFDNGKGPDAQRLLKEHDTAGKLNVIANKIRQTLQLYEDGETALRKEDFHRARAAWQDLTGTVLRFQKGNWYYLQAQSHLTTYTTEYCAEVFHTRAQNYIISKDYKTARHYCDLAEKYIPGICRDQVTVIRKVARQFYLDSRGGGISSKERKDKLRRAVELLREGDPDYPKVMAEQARNR